VSFVGSVDGLLYLGVYLIFYTHCPLPCSIWLKFDEIYIYIYVHNLIILSMCQFH